jgi:hypothetical protein
MYEFHFDTIIKDTGRWVNESDPQPITLHINNETVIAVDKKEYDDWNDVIPFYKNITKEGILLWKTA